MFLFVIGYPVSHSKSPKMHNATLDSLGLLGKYTYNKAEIKNIEDVAKFVRINSFHGASITIPHKETIIPYLDEISDSAKKIGAVNTIYKKKDKLCGENTDWFGVMKTLEKEYDTEILKNQNALVIGSGGASKAVVYALQKLGMNIEVMSRTKKKIDDLRVINKIEDTSYIKLIVNTTPLGMTGKHENKTPIDKKFISKDHICFDVIYTPEKTKFLKDAEEKNAKIINGEKMLRYQGEMAMKFWINTTTTKTHKY